MSTEIDSSSAPETHKMSAPSSAATTSGQKLSIFAAKSGFVIPKNKLSGSLVPIFRGAKKLGVTGAINEESSKQMERRSKWGPDLTQDATVRRGKALALQIRVDQITKQLESEKLEVGDTQNLPSVAENPDQSRPGPQINSKSEMLELEKREAIGEILKLDPSYKPPRGFKPLLKEANIPLPVQEYPGYNFVGLIYGPEGDNQKRLEKETGAKIKIHGSKADTAEKVEIKPGTDIQCSYKDMHINISADSFDKVDAAMSIIELLIASVTGNLAAGSTPSVSRDSTNVMSQSQEGPHSHADSLSLENQAMLQPVTVTQMHGDNFQYSSPWFSVVPSHSPVFTSSGSVVPPHPPGLARTPHFPSQTSNMASAFGAQPAPVAGFQPIVLNQNLSVQAPPPRQILQYSHMTQASPFGEIATPRNPSIMSVQNISTPTNASLSFPVTLSQPTAIGQLQSSMHLPISGMSQSPLLSQPLTHLGVSSGQNEAPVTVKMSVGPGNMGSMAPPMVPPARPVPLHQQPDAAFKSQQSNMSMMPRSSTFPPHQVGIPPGPPSSLRPMHVSIAAPTHSSVNHLLGPVSFPSPGISSLPLPQQAGIPNSASGVAPYHTHVKPPVLVTSKSGNFTFQSHLPNADYGQVVSGPHSQSGASQEPPSGPRPPPFGFGVPDRPLQIFPRTQFPDQVDQTVPFGGRPGSILNSVPPPRHAAFPYGGQPAPRSSVPQLGMNNFISAPQMPNLTSTAAQRGMPIRQSYPPQMARPDIPMHLNHKFVNNPLMASGKLAYPTDQIYDPFSPTSAPPHQKGNPGR